MEFREIDRKQFDFTNEVISTNSCFHQWQALLKIAIDDAGDYESLNKHHEFWEIVLNALRDKWILGFTKLYDESKKADDLVSFVQYCKKNKGCFSMRSLRTRFESSNASPAMIDRTLNGKSDPTDEQFDVIINLLKNARSLVSETIKPIRDESIAHKGKIIKSVEMIDLYRQLNPVDMQLIIGSSFTSITAISACYKNGSSLELSEQPAAPEKPMVPWSMYERSKDLLLRASNLPGCLD